MAARLSSIDLWVEICKTRDFPPPSFERFGLITKLLNRSSRLLSSDIFVKMEGLPLYTE